MKIQTTNLKVFIPVVGRGRGLAHLGGEEVGESLAGEPVDVVDGVPGGQQHGKAAAGDAGSGGPPAPPPV